MPKQAQPIEVPRNRMVLVITQGHLLQPLTDYRGGLVHLVAQFCLDCVQLGHHPLLGRFPPDDEGPIAPALPATMREAQEREGLRFSLSTLLPALSGEPPELNQSRFIRM